MSAALVRKGTINVAKARARVALAFAKAKHGRFPVAPKVDRTVDGIVFDSKKEAKRYGQLKLLERAGKIKYLLVQPTWKVEINGQHFCRYTADFRYLDMGTASWIVEDTKSTGTAKDAAYRLRKKAAEMAHGLKITEVVS